MNTKFAKLAFVIAILFFITLLISKIGEWNIKRNTPHVLLDAIEKAKLSKDFSARIGELMSEKYSYNIVSESDSIVNYSFSLIGDKATITIHSMKTLENGMYVEKCDTIVSKN